MIWKDRIKQYPHRYTLTNVSGSTYDFAEVTGEVIEAGTPVNAENLNKLIQRDGDDIKDTVTTFAEAGTRENIATGEKTSTIFGKIKKWLADLKPHAFNDLATVQGTETDKAPTNKLLTDSTCAAFYRNLTDPRLGLTTTSDMIALATAMIDFSILEATVTSAYTNILPPVPVCKLRVEKHSVNRISAFATYKDSNVTTQYYFIGHIKLGDTSSQWSGWEKILTNKVISTVMPISSAAASNTRVMGERLLYDQFAKTAPLANPTFTGTVTVPAPTNPTDAVRLQDVMELSAVYDKVIRTQAEFEALIASSTWLGAVSVALVGQFTLSTANNSGIKIPATVKQIHGYNGAKITVTNFEYDISTAKGGLWYDTYHISPDYNIRDLELDCTGRLDGFGIVNCTNLINCKSTATGNNTIGYGFRDCINLVNCIGIGIGIINYGYGFYSCVNLSNCEGKGTGTNHGYSFAFITSATNCSDGGSSTNMWYGTNTGIDPSSYKNPAYVPNTTLNA